MVDGLFCCICLVLLVGPVFVDVGYADPLVLVNAPLGPASSGCPDSFARNAERGALIMVFPALLHHIFCLRAGPSFCELHFRLDLDYACHLCGGRWEEGAAGCVGHLERGLLLVLRGTYRCRSEIFLWRHRMWVQMALQNLLDFSGRDILDLGHIFAEVLCIQGRKVTCGIGMTESGPD